MEETLTVTQLAKKFGRDRSSVLRWIEKNYFPNAELKETFPSNYWVVPVSDLKDFQIPKPGPKKTKK